MPVMEVNDANFDAEVLQVSEPVLVDFWAPWCGPCRAMSPVIDEVAEETAGRMKVVKLNVDESAETAGKYSIRSIPTLILFKGGEPAKQLVGMQSKDALLALV